MDGVVVQRVVDGLSDAGIDLCAFLPDSWLAPIIESVSSSDRFKAVRVANENDGVSICAGAWLGGRRAVMIAEASGFRAACETLARLGPGLGIPVFLLLSYRGDLGDRPSWAPPQGKTLEPLLSALGIHARVVRDLDRVADVITRVPATMAASGNHVAVVLGYELCIGKQGERGS